MIYLTSILAIYLILMLIVASFSMPAGLVLLALGLIFGGASAASLAG
jgi:hypothetical protein